MPTPTDVWQVIFHRGTRPRWKIPAAFDGSPLRWFVARDERVYWALYQGEGFGWRVLDNDGKTIADHIKTIAQVRTWAEQGVWT